MRAFERCANSLQWIWKKKWSSKYFLIKSEVNNRNCFWRFHKIRKKEKITIIINIIIVTVIIIIIITLKKSLFDQQTIFLE